jgi:hypothetical protein
VSSTGWEAPQQPRRRGLIVAAVVGVVAAALLSRGADTAPPSRLEVVREPWPPTVETPPEPAPEPANGWLHVSDPTGGVAAAVEPTVVDGRLTVWLDSGAGWTFDPRLGWGTVASRPLAPARGRSATWTGEQLILWGGEASGMSASTGAAWSPGSDGWQMLDPPELGGRAHHGAVWAPEVGRLFIWGGRVRTPLPRLSNQGAAWDAAANRWEPLPPAPLSPRQHPLLAWTGTELLVWGGVAAGRPLHDGALLDPATGSWRAMASGAPLFRGAPGGVWTGELLMVWGRPVERHRAPGWTYDPGRDAWTSLSRLIAQERGSPHLVAVGDAVVVWGGRDRGGLRRDGFVLDPRSGRWRKIPAAPSGWRRAPLVGGTDEGLIVWGGTAWGRPRPDGWLFPLDPRTDGVAGGLETDATPSARSERRGGELGQG